MKKQITIENLRLFECLSSGTRLRILEILGEGSKNIGELAGMLKVSSAIVTRHIAMLEECGLVRSKNISGKRGLQKLCSLAADEITLSLKREETYTSCTSASIPIGHFTAYEVTPACGLASEEGLIGVCDDPRYFSSPEKAKAALIWFQSGWVEYRIPSYLIPAQPVSAVEIRLELCSEYPGYRNDWPSDIYFYLNGYLAGIWTCPGDFGGKKGVYTPAWWKSGTEYGLLKTIRITREGCKIDGIKLSEATLDNIPIKYGEDLIFRIASPADAKNPGGVNIFGRGFGNYSQDIEVRIEYD